MHGASFQGAAALQMHAWNVHDTAPSPMALGGDLASPALRGAQRATTEGEPRFSWASDAAKVRTACDAFRRCRHPPARRDRRFLFKRVKILVGAETPSRIVCGRVQRIG